MFYCIKDENSALCQHTAPDCPTDICKLWSDFEVISGTTTKYRSCPICGDPISSFLLNNPVVGKFNNWHFPDVIFLSGDDLIVSEYFKNAFVSNKMVGISYFSEIQIYGNIQPQFKYYNTRIDYSTIVWNFRKWTRHKISHRTNCSVCGKTIEHANGLLFSEDQLNEYDIFQLYSLPGEYWVSERMAEMISRCSFSNITLIPADKFSL